MMFDEQYGQLSVNTLPGHYGYGDSDGGELQGATLMSQGAVNPKGLLHEQPASTEMGGLLDKIKSAVQSATNRSSSQRVQDGEYVWDFYEGDKIVLVSGPSGTAGSTTYAAGTQAYEVVAEKAAEQAASGSNADPARAAAVGAGVGSFFNTVTPTIIGLFGPTTDPDPPLPPANYDATTSRTSPLLIAGGIVGVGLLGFIIYKVATKE
jgi:hypothetical protein